MTSKKSASGLAAAVAAAKTSANDLGDRLGPAAVDARDRLVPMVEEARERISPLVEEARERIVPLVTEATENALESLAPAVEDAKERLADLSESIAAMLDERVPGRTPVVEEPKSGGAVKKLLVLAGVGGAAALAAQKLRAGKSSTPTWQSTAPSTPASGTPASGTPAPGTPAPTTDVASAAAAAAASAAGTASGTNVQGTTGNDAAAGTPDEAAADATEVAHEPTTPDAPAEVIDVKE